MKEKPRPINERDLEAIEHAIGAETHTLNENFVAKVMSKVEERPTFLRRLSMMLVPRRGFAAALSAVAVLVCVTVIYDREGAPLPADVDSGRQNEQSEGSELQPLVQEPAKINTPNVGIYNDSRMPSAVSDLVSRFDGTLDDTLEKDRKREGSARQLAEHEERTAEVFQGVLERMAPSGGAPAELAPLAPPPAAKEMNDIAGATRGESGKSEAIQAPAPQQLASKAVAGNALATKAMDSLSEVGHYEDRRWSPPEQKIFVPQDTVWQQPSREQYRQYEENSRISVASQPVSTFSIDVDTGSYTNVRRFLTNGSLPPADAVRIEEFLNYFTYNYPKQFERPFSVNAEIAPSPLEPERLLLKLGIRARDLERSEAGWNLVFLVDVSGSMNEPNKLPLVKQTLKLLVKEMRPQDRVALVTYAGSAGVVLDSTSVSERERIVQAIDSLGAGGSTNGSGGIMAAYRVAEASRVSGGVNRVILATDGDFNVGISSFDELMRLIEEKRRSGVTLTTLGFGTGNYQEANMEQLANRGNGNYFYIDSFREARRVVEEGLTGAMQIVAKDVKLQVEFNPERVVEYRLIGYDNRKLDNRDFSNDQVDAGEIGSGHTVTALYEIVLKGSPLGQRFDESLRYANPTPSPEMVKMTDGGRNDEVAFLKVRYKEPEGSVSKLLEFPIAATQIQSDAKRASADFRFAAAVSYFGHLLRQSAYRGNYTFTDIVQLAAEAKGDDPTGARQEFIELVRSAAATSR